MSKPKLDRLAAAAVTADDMVDAALHVLITDGLDALSMRRVAAELGVSPMPLYNRIGNKDALLDAIAERAAGTFVLDRTPGETVASFAKRWCHHLRDRRLALPDSSLLLRAGRGPMEAAARPLILALTDEGVARDDAITTARLLMWAVLGHVAIEIGHPTTADAHAVDVDELFARHVALLIADLPDVAG